MATKAKNETSKDSAREESLRAATILAGKVDREALAGKTRVHTLAKMLGLASRDVVAEFERIGQPKIAQSTLSPAEVADFLDRFVAEYGEQEKPAKKKAAKKSTKKTAKRTAKRTTKKPAEKSGEEVPAQEDKVQEEPKPNDDERLRYRVQKNVDNEIHQIVEKVDKQLEESIDEELIDSESVEEGEDFEDSYLPEITPKPDTPTLTAEYAPIFIAPGVGEHADDEDGFDVEDISDANDDGQEENDSKSGSKRRRGRRGTSRGKGNNKGAQDDLRNDNDDDSDNDFTQVEEPKALRGSARLEAQRRRRAEIREEGRKRRPIVSQEEFLARRESVQRTMIVRERARHDDLGRITQVGVLEDDLLVEHFVTSDAQASIIGNIYLGRVQNVLPSMEAAFIDIGTGRNGVLYAGEVDWKSAGLGGRSRRIENALHSGDQVLVQVSKDPVGHKGARLTTQISLAGRYLVYVPGGRSAGISRKLPAPERKRLKSILTKVVPGDGGAIIRTAAENVSEDAIALDVRRLHDSWKDIQKHSEKEKASKGAKPVTLYEEPPLLVKVIRDLFNEDFDQLVIDGEKPYNTISSYVKSVAPDLFDRIMKFDRAGHGGQDAFERYRIDEQIQKALSRKVWLPSGGTLVIDRTEAMTVVDVNTGKFTGSGGNLEETVTRNNLEAAEEIVRQMRLRDLGGMIVVDFIDMILPENRDLVLRRLKEALGRDRTRHQVSEVTSLGLVQMTRKRLGTGLLETFSSQCDCCEGRGLILHDDPVEDAGELTQKESNEHKKPERKRGRKAEKKRNIEDLAASVVVVPDTTSPEPGSIEDIAFAAVDHAEATDEVGEWPSPLSKEQEAALQGGKKDEKTYEEAVKEFEASPRRKRRTRGNSRSDHRPRREEFTQDVPATQEEEPEQKRQESAVVEIAAETTKRKSSRGRRRVRRSLSGKLAPAQVKPQKQSKDKTQVVEEQDGDVIKKVVRGAGGRRRAVRRKVSGGAASKHASFAKATDNVKRASESNDGDRGQADRVQSGHASESGQSSKARGRGRRRSTRRRRN